MGAEECSSVPMGAEECSSVPMGAEECSSVPMGAEKCSAGGVASNNEKTPETSGSSWLDDG